MLESEGFDLNYLKEDYTAEFKNAMNNWQIASFSSEYNFLRTTIESIKKYENIIKNKLMIFNKVSPIWIEKGMLKSYHLHCKAGKFITIGQLINRNKGSLVFTEIEMFNKQTTELDWYKTEPTRGTSPIISLRKTNGRPLKLREKFDNLKNRKMW